MIDVIHWCLELGVPAISVYAFSIDNFKRSADEVGSLMQLAEEKYCELAKVGSSVRVTWTTIMVAEGQLYCQLLMILYPLRRMG